MSDSAYVTTPARERATVIADVAVIDVESGTSTPHQDIRLDGGAISSISVHVPEGHGPDVEVVDAAGRFAIPAFVDAHAHPLNHPDEVDGAYALMLTAGIAGYRQMSGSDDLLERRAAGTLREPPGAPRLLALPGELLTPVNAGTAGAAARTVRHQAAHGADFIKAGFTSARTFMAALRAANEAGIPMAGHLPEDLDPREPAREGLRCIEHLGPRTSLVAASSRREEQVRAMSRSLPPLPPMRFLSKVVEKSLAKMVVNPSKSTSAQVAAAYELADRTYDERKAQELAALFVEHETWNCPTLIRLHTQTFGDQPVHLEDPRAAYIHPDELAAWRDASATLAELPGATKDALAEDWEAKRRLTRVFAEAGVPMLVGTDADGAGWVIPGLAIHDEFDLLAGAGVSPLRILQMATLDAARFFAREDTAGRVEPGCEADLVLLEENPAADQRALHGIAGVVRDGRHYGREELDGVLARLEAAPSAR